MDFGKALKALKQGKRVRRTFWEELGHYLYLVPLNSYPAVTEHAKKEFGVLVPYESYLAIKINASVIPWSPNHQDLIFDDWEILD